MKNSLILGAFLLALPCTAQTVDSIAAPQDSIAVSESALPAEPSTTDSAAFFNPFGQNNAPEADTVDYSANPHHDPAMHHTAVMTGIGSQKPLLDLLLDISMGYSLSRFSTDSPFYSSESRGDLLFNIGIILPIGKRFFGEIAFRNTQIKYGMSDSTADQMGSYFTTKSEESRNYISLPMSFGVRHDFGSMAPYAYAVCEPAYLTSSGMMTRRKSHSLFLPDSAVYTIVSIQDKNVIDSRTRYQVFLGGGIGTEISYGYGLIYLDAGVRVAMRESGYLDFTPQETTSTLLFFPISMGLRFYL